MSNASIIRAPPTPAQIDMIRMLSSKIHYAFPTRPPVGSPLRTPWDDRFLRDVAALLNLLNNADFKTLPTLAMGCAWAANLRLRKRPREEMLDVDAIQPVVPGHPALNELLPKGMKRLTYTADDFGPTGLLPEEVLPDQWWAAFASADVSMDEPSVEGSHSSDGGTHDTRGASAGVSAGVSAGTSAKDVRRGRGKPTSEAPSGGGEMDVGGGDEAVAEVPAADVPATHSNVLSALARIEPEDIPNAWIEHPSRLGNNQSLSGFMAWAYWKILSFPEVFGDPVFTPHSFSPVLLPPMSEPPSWFQDQFGVDKPSVPRSAEGTTAEATASNKPSTAPAGSTRPATRASKGKERAASPTPSVSAAASTPASASARTSRSRAAKPSRSASAAPPKSLEPAEVKVEASKPAPEAVRSAKTRSKSRAASTDEHIVAANAASSRGRPPAAGSSGAPIDVDAMDIDGATPSPAKLRGRPIDVRHLRLRRSPVRVRGSEFSYQTTSNMRPSYSPASETESPTESLSEPLIDLPTEAVDVTVAPVQGSWRSIPRLDEVLAQLQSATVAESGSEQDDLGVQPSPATLDNLPPLTDHGGTALPETELLKSNLNAVAGIIECTKEWAETLEAQSKQVLERSGQALPDERDYSRAEFVDAWFNESQDLGDDVARLSRQLADTNKWVSLLARCLKDLMASPIDGDRLEEILHEVARLKYAYETSVRKFAALQEDVRPVRREVHRLRWRTDIVEQTAEVAANEAACAVEPLLANLYSQLSAEIDAVRMAVSRPMERLASTIAQPGGLTAPMLQEVITAIREAVAEMWRTTTSINKFIESTWARLSSGLSVKVRDLEERLLRVEGTGAESQLRDTAAAPNVSLPQLARAIDGLGQRVDALQRQFADDEAFDRRVRESLERIGITADFGDEGAFDRRVRQSLERLGISGEVLQRVVVGHHTRTT